MYIDVLLLQIHQQLKVKIEEKCESSYNPQYFIFLFVFKYYFMVLISSRKQLSRKTQTHVF